MNKKIILMTLLLFSSSFINAQDDRHHRKGPGEKMKDLEKLKLIEALDMDEETTLKFFSRRNAHMDKMEVLRKKEDNLIEELNDLAQSTENQDDPQIKKMIDESFKIRDEMDEERKIFINSLADILTYKQVAKLIAFEPRFKKEIREILFKERRHAPPR
ncbi:MAG: hypothetical protein ACM339_14320 [Ignavibacteria bacterium]